MDIIPISGVSANNGDYLKVEFWETSRKQINLFDHSSEINLTELGSKIKRRMRLQRDENHKSSVFWNSEFSLTTACIGLFQATAFNLEKKESHQNLRLDNANSENPSLEMECQTKV